MFPAAEHLHLALLLLIAFGVSAGLTACLGVLTHPDLHSGRFQ
ncbi:hypothetical protein [Desulfonatronum thiosulfatophilum]|nr:hypothetical protein [Desulfonatronum thiosulfatophilum]